MRWLVVVLVGAVAMAGAAFAFGGQSGNGGSAYALVNPNGGSPVLIASHTSGFSDVTVGPFGRGDYCLTPAPGVNINGTAVARWRRSTPMPRQPTIDRRETPSICATPLVEYSAISSAAISPASLPSSFGGRPPRGLLLSRHAASLPSVFRGEMRGVAGGARRRLWAASPYVRQRRAEWPVLTLGS